MSECSRVRYWARGCSDQHASELPGAEDRDGRDFAMGAAFDQPCPGVTGFRDHAMHRASWRHGPRSAHDFTGRLRAADAAPACSLLSVARRALAVVQRPGACPRRGRSFAGSGAAVCSGCARPALWAVHGMGRLPGARAEGGGDQALREATRTGRPCGDGAFVKRLEDDLDRLLAPQKRGPKPRSAETPEIPGLF